MKPVNEALPIINDMGGVEWACLCSIYARCIDRIRPWPWTFFLLLFCNCSSIFRLRGRSCFHSVCGKNSIHKPGPRLPSQPHYQLLRPKSWGRTKSSTARVRYINPLLWLQYFILTRIELKFICFRMYATIRYGLKYVWDVWRTSRVGGKKLTTQTRPGKCRFLISFPELYRSSFLKGKLRLYTATWKRLRLEKQCIGDLV